ncbi:MAG TPA: alpha/beta hydrolase [Burkholderiales bacterium]
MSTLETSFGRCEYLDLGHGDPIVLVHGSASSGAQWRATAERLSGRYRVLAPDLCGYGTSANWPGRSAFHLEHEAEIVRRLLEFTGGPAHMVGHSYGGAVALHVARRHGDSLRSLTLIEPAAFHLLRSADRRAAAEIAQAAACLRRALASGEFVRGFGLFVDYWNGPGTWAAISADKQASMARRLPKVILDFHAAFNEPGGLDDLRSLAVPTLLLYGTRSPPPARRICALLARALPHARLAAIEGAGHMSPVTHRPAVETLLTAHLNRSSASERYPPGEGVSRAAGARVAAMPV